MLKVVKMHWLKKVSGSNGRIIQNVTLKISATFVSPLQTSPEEGGLRNHAGKRTFNFRARFQVLFGLGINVVLTVQVIAYQQTLQ